jgi:hypothetical protein
MSYNNKRLPGTKARDFQRAWSELVPEASFAGMTLADFETALAPFDAAAKDLNDLTVQAAAAKTVLNQEESALRGMLNKVAHSVRADLNHGDDSPLYRAMGYIPRSERASGLTRKDKTTGETAPETAPNEEAAA